VPNFISIRSGVLILWGSNFWLSHKKEKSPLTQGLNYRSACDQYVSRLPRNHVEQWAKLATAVTPVQAIVFIPDQCIVDRLSTTSTIVYHEAAATDTHAAAFCAFKVNHCLEHYLASIPPWTHYASPPTLPLPMFNPLPYVDSNPSHVKAYIVACCIAPNDRWWYPYSRMAVDIFSKWKEFRRRMNKKWEGIFSSPAYYRICMRTVVGFSIGVWGRKWIYAFLAPQNTSGQVLVERWLPPSRSPKSCPLEKSNTLWA